MPAPPFGHRFSGLLPVIFSMVSASLLFALSSTIRRNLIHVSPLGGDSSPSPSNSNVPSSFVQAEPAPPATNEFALEDTFDANDASGVLITNMGLVFSILYGFIFNRAYQRFDDISRVFSTEIANLHQLVNMIRFIEFDADTQRALLVRLRHYAFQIRREVRSGEILNDAGHSTDDLYALVPFIKKLVTAGDASSFAESSVAFDREILNSSLESIKSLLEARYERWDLFSKNIHWLVKSLLIFSANLTFFGVSMMQSGSARIDFLYCSVTIVSIGAIMAALSDLDQFFTGFIRLDVSRLDRMFRFSGEHGDDGEVHVVESTPMGEGTSAGSVNAKVNLENSKRFAEQMMSAGSTSKVRWSLKEVSRTVMREIKENRDSSVKNKYVVSEVETNSGEA
jgi:hypothetical protein